VNVARLLLGLAALASAACEAQVRPDYRGEPLATIEGQVVTEAGTDETVPLAAAIVWYAGIGPDNSSDNYHVGVIRVRGVQAAVTGAFPAAFRLDLYDPPPSDALSSAGLPSLNIQFAVDPHPLASPPVKVAWGYIAALRADIGDGELVTADVRGMSENALLVYFSDDVPPDSDFAKGLAALGVGRERGYHLFAYPDNPPTDEVARTEECIWGRACVHLTGDAFPGYLADRLDAAFAECNARRAGLKSCGIALNHVISDDTFNANAACASMFQDARDKTACVGIRDVFSPVANPGGFSYPVVIRLGERFFRPEIE
jgi:hypothetical protein